MNPLVVLCLVVGISDGDTIKVRCGESDQQTVRLTQIDTPERGQAFGARAKVALSDLVFGKHVELVGDGQDRYGRTPGAVNLDGQHINLATVSQGLVWCYRQYLTDEA